MKKSMLWAATFIGVISIVTMVCFAAGWQPWMLWGWYTNHNLIDSGNFIAELFSLLVEASLFGILLGYFVPERLRVIQIQKETLAYSSVRKRILSKVLEIRREVAHIIDMSAGSSETPGFSYDFQEDKNFKQFKSNYYEAFKTNNCLFFSSPENIQMEPQPDWITTHLSEDYDWKSIFSSIYKMTEFVSELEQLQVSHASLCTPEIMEEISDAIEEIKETIPYLNEFLSDYNSTFHKLAKSYSGNEKAIEPSQFRVIDIIMGVFADTNDLIICDKHLGAKQKGRLELYEELDESLSSLTEFIALSNFSNNLTSDDFDELSQLEASQAQRYPIFGHLRFVMVSERDLISEAKILKNRKTQKSRF